MIYNVDKLDILAERKDGGVELYILSSGSLDDTEDTQKLLLDKIENYLDFINSDEFKKEFPNVPEGKIRIILKMEEEPPPIIRELCKKIETWVQENGANFVTYVGD
ncbi:DUF6572 domain-containing protein [Acetivibrio clariflavus]|uniref:DUF6572 domain-containing protein n=1 Tax=Acetivibrio clariflavus TaxID=288965 RepID=UPI000484E511|nr:DUF6572 domain-containing protein [Acetivibrio clariflavus]